MGNYLDAATQMSDMLTQQTTIFHRSRNARRIILLNLFAFISLYVGYLLSSGLNLLEGSEVKIVSRGIAFILFLVSVVIQNKIHLGYILILIFVGVLFAISQAVIATNVLFLILILISLRQLSSREISLLLFYSTLVMIGLHAMLLATGQLSLQSTNFEGRSRSLFGFANANQASAVYLSFFVASLFLFLESPNRKTSVICAVSFLVVTFITLATDSRTSTFALAMLFHFWVCGFFFSRSSGYRRILKVAAGASPLIAAAATYYLTTSRSFELNVLLSLRPQFFQEFVEGISFAEFLIGWTPEEGVGVDNLFLTLLSGLGALGTLVFLLTASVFCFRRGAAYAPLIVVLMTTSIFEAFIIRPEIPASVIFLSVLLFTDKRRQLSSCRGPHIYVHQ